VVEAFERAYLEELLRRHGGNVTGAAEQSGMLRSALQRLLRKHDLHSADFRSRGAPGRYAT
jgi:two-component system response regulator GlrR